MLLINEMAMQRTALMKKLHTSRDPDERTLMRKRIDKINQSIAYLYRQQKETKRADK